MFNSFDNRSQKNNLRIYVPHSEFYLSDNCSKVVHTISVQLFEINSFLLEMLCYYHCVTLIDCFQSSLPDKIKLKWRKTEWRMGQNHEHFAPIACMKFKRFIAQEKRLKSNESYYHRSEISYDHILVLTRVIMFYFCAEIIKCLD